MTTFASLPEEIILGIISWLQPPDIVRLQLVSKHLLRLCRDDSFWRQLALLPAASSRYRQLTGRSDDSLPVPNSYSNGTADCGLADQSLSVTVKERARIIANWDINFPQEPPRWYDEYIHRNSQIVVNWLQQPMTDTSASPVPIDVKGLALYRPPSLAHQAFAVSPLEDGSICLWDVKGTASRKGSVYAHSKPGLLWEHVPPHTYPRRSTVTDPGILESVTVDNHRGIAFFAIGHILVEIDLTAMRVVSEKQYDFSINTLSNIQPGVPLTVGTTLGLHLNDHRTPSHSLSPYAALPQPGPISIEHVEMFGNPGQISDDIFVAGRYSNILHYDRRLFPKIRGSIYSGAKLCSLTSLPHPFPFISSEQRKNLGLSEDQVEKMKHEPGRTLIACGEYKSKGSLEVYGLDASSPDLCGAAYQQHAPIKNRVTAASSKALYVANHGNRIVYSDGQGYLKWVERDGCTEVRRHKIGNSERSEKPSLFRSMPASDDIAMKLISTRTISGSGEDSQVNADDILFYTGDKLGLATFSSKSPFFAEDFVDGAVETAEAQAEQLYSERMRLALERQAQDVHFVQELGAGTLGAGF